MCGEADYNSGSMLTSVGIATVLVVEDDPSLRDLYRQTLLASGYRVMVAGDGLTALALLEEQKPDVVILDLALPRVSGWDVYRDLRSRSYFAKVPIVVVTGNDLRDIPLEDVAGFLQKPIDPQRLVGAVDRARKLF